MGRSAPATFASVVAIAALALIGKPSAAGAQDLRAAFPSKPVRIIVPYTPGSPNDVMARLLAAYTQPRPDGQPWTARTLAEAAGCGRSSAASFLQRQRSPASEPTQ